MKVSRGDVVLVEFPFTDRIGSKVRPALVVQNDELNARIEDTILAAISRSMHRVSAYQVVVDLATREAASTGLRQNSSIQCENLLTLDRRFIIAVIGRLPDALRHQVEAALRQTLGLE